MGDHRRSLELQGSLYCQRIFSPVNLAKSRYPQSWLSSFRNRVMDSSMAARATVLPWHKIYQEAILEPDCGKVRGRVEYARKSLVERLRQLDQRCPDERWELDRLLNALRMLALLDKTSNAA
jgi:hypothetical protein